MLKYKIVSISDSSDTGVTIPDSVTTIGDEAFKGCDHLTLSVSAGSYAEQYAKENNIPYQYSDEPDLSWLN